MIDEMALRKDAYHLGYLFIDLDRAKVERRPPPEARVMSPGFGPSDPLNVTALSDGMEIHLSLHSWCKTMASHLGEEPPTKEEGPTMAARWVAMKAYYIAEHPEGESLHYEIQDWIKQLTHIVGRGPDVVDVSKKLEQYKQADVILQHLHKHGYAYNRDSLRKLAERSGGAITTEQWGGRTTYRLTEILTHLKEKETAQ